MFFLHLKIPSIAQEKFSIIPLLDFSYQWLLANLIALYNYKIALVMSTVANYP